MQVIQLNTVDIRGGASRAAYRLHRGLQKSGCESLMLVQQKFSEDHSVCACASMDGGAWVDQMYLSVIQSQYFDRNRTLLSNTLFSLAYPGVDLSTIEAVVKADVINLHWLVYFQSPITLQRLFALGKPVVWTLHDMWAFTGGCHYSAGCSGYERECTACPQLRGDPFALPQALLKDKQELFAAANLTIVTPSRWLAECAERSRLFRHCRIEVIPNSLPIDVFAPMDKAEARRSLGIGPEVVTLLAGSENGDELRKGFAELMQALTLCLENANFQYLVREQKIVLLCFGRPNEQIEALGIPVRVLKQIDNDAQLSQVYSAAELFILPSLEDNLPNTMLEALSCGTPVIAFKTGGIPEVVEDGVTGRLAGDVADLAGVILDAVFSPESRRQWGRMGRHLIEQNFSIAVQAERYLTLYRDLLEGGERPGLPVCEPEEPSVCAPLVTMLGPHFSRVYGQILLQSLRQEVLAEQQRSTELLQLEQQRYAELLQLLREEKQRLEAANVQIWKLETNIAAIKTSKFWRLRTQWLKLRALLGRQEEQV